MCSSSQPSPEQREAQASNLALRVRAATRAIDAMPIEEIVPVLRHAMERFKKLNNGYGVLEAHDLERDNS